MDISSFWLTHQSTGNQYQKQSSTFSRLHHWQVRLAHQSERPAFKQKPEQLSSKSSILNVDKTLVTKVISNLKIRQFMKSRVALKPEC